MKRKATSDSNYQRINPTRVTENQPTAIGSRNRNVNISCEPIVVDYNHSPQGFDAHLFRNEMDMDTHRLAPDEFEGVSSKQNVSNINNDQDAEFENDELLVKEENYRVLWRTVNPYYYKQDLIEVQGKRLMLCSATLNLKLLHANFKKRLIPDIASSRKSIMHSNVYYNESNMNYSGCICKCTTNKKGLLHYKYVGEQAVPAYDPWTCSYNKFYHYRIAIWPSVNFKSDHPTVIRKNNNEYVFEGFSILSHYPLENIPVCLLHRYNRQYKISANAEPISLAYTLQDLELFQEFLFDRLLELPDWSLKDPNGDGRLFYFIPLFVRKSHEKSVETLSVAEVLEYILNFSQPLFDVQCLLYDNEDRKKITNEVTGSLVYSPFLKPSTIRVDDIDWSKVCYESRTYPKVIHCSHRPHHHSYLNNKKYLEICHERNTLREGFKAGVLLKSGKQVSELMRKAEEKLSRIKESSNLKREVRVVIDGERFNRIGLKGDITQHALLLPTLVHHIRFHRSLYYFEEAIGYSFKRKSLLQRALANKTHANIRDGCEMNHILCSLFNCGIKNPHYAGGNHMADIDDLKELNPQKARKILSTELETSILDNETLEYLGDAVIKYISSVELFFMFPDLSEGDLSVYRSALVNNKQLGRLGKKLKLDEFLAYSHEALKNNNLDRSIANGVEALFGAMYLENGLDRVREIFGKLTFDDDSELMGTWMNLVTHPLQEQFPDGDRILIPKSQFLQGLTDFEESIGVEFKHIRLLAKAFTHPSAGLNHLTIGDYQRLEFLGDAILSYMLASHVYRQFPHYREGHLSILRSSLSNNELQSKVAEDLLLDKYLYTGVNDRDKILHSKRQKIMADILESFIGALFIDKGISYVEAFCSVCFFSKIKDIIPDLGKFDPKSRLNNYCIMMRKTNKQPEYPKYVVIRNYSFGNQREFTVEVHLHGKCIATGIGSSIKMAEKNAASKALESDLFKEVVTRYSKTVQKGWKKKVS